MEEMPENSSWALSVCRWNHTYQIWRKTYWGPVPAASSSSNLPPPHSSSPTIVFVLSQADPKLFILSCVSILSLYLSLPTLFSLLISVLNLMQHAGVPILKSHFLFMHKTLKGLWNPWFAIVIYLKDICWNNIILTVCNPASGNVSQYINIRAWVLKHIAVCAIRAPLERQASILWPVLSMQSAPCPSSGPYEGMRCTQLWSDEPKGGAGGELTLCALYWAITQT